MTADLTLFYAPLSCASVPLMALLEARAAFTLKHVDLALEHHRGPDFERLNPKRKVPVLVAGDQVLTETVAIQLWIADHFPDAGLMPDAGPTSCKALAHLVWCASTIHPALTPNARPERYCDLPGSEDSVRRCARRLLAEHFAVGETALGDTTWFFDDRYTAADTYYYWCLRRAMQLGFAAADFPASRAHLQRVQAREATQRFLAIEQEVIAMAMGRSAGASMRVQA